MYHSEAERKQPMNPENNKFEVVLGVDTHLDVHVGVVISQAGKLLGTHSISTNTSGYLDLLSWAQLLDV
jgi:hypothetical protein